jgi:CubicO group peptidase (beta-lactamase class C family)
MRPIAHIFTFAVLLFLYSLPQAYAESDSGPLDANTPMQTVGGNPFTAPAGWTVTVKGTATFLSAPEEGSQIVLVDVEADTAEAALEAAWSMYKEPTWPIINTNEQADNGGWSKRKQFIYQTSPNEKRGVLAGTWFADGSWTVYIYDVANEVGGKYGSQISLMLGSLRPQGFERESFAGVDAKKLGAAEIAELVAFVERGLELTGVPGTSIGIIQDGKVIYSGGVGVRELGSPEKVDGVTLYMIASNTKGLATLLLAKLVDEGKVDWKDKVVDVYPGFKLGDAETTDQVLVEHLVCACTGLPRQDMEWILEFSAYSPEESMKLLGTMQPTTGFGELFQYSNVMASAGGYVGARLVHPEHELGKAFDMAMQEKVFDPLGMSATTFDFDVATNVENFARAHSVDVNGDPAIAVMEVNRAVIPVRPAGAAWSSVNDMLKYIAMELAAGKLPDGEQYIGPTALQERAVPKVPTGETGYYGMGLMLETEYGISVVHHGGDLIGYHSDMMWLPEHGVGAVVLTNGDPGWLIRGLFQRKLLEVLFDGDHEAEKQLASAAEQFKSGVSVAYDLLEVPASTEEAEKLAQRYANEALGEIIVERRDGVTAFDFGEWRSEVGSMTNPDGTVSFVTTAVGLAGLAFVVAEGEDKALVMRDAQHEYVFDAL